MKKLSILLFSIFICLQNTGCTIVNTSFPTSGPTLSELDISEEFTSIGKP